MTHDTPVIYLDFDGTAHPIGTPAMDAFGYLHPEWPGVFCWLPLLESALRPYPSMRVVVSSSWRFFHGEADLRAFLGPLGSRFAGTMRTGRVRMRFSRTLASWVIRASLQSTMTNRSGTATATVTCAFCGAPPTLESVRRGC